MNFILTIFLPIAYCVLPLAAFAQLPDSVSLLTFPVYTNLEDALKNPSQVYRLSLKKKKLKTFPMEILKLKNLEELDLSKNRLSKLPEAIGTLTHLKILNVSKNKLEYLPDSIGELKNLKKMDISRNNLIALPKRIGELENLEVLDLWDNNLSVFPDEMRQLRKLRWLDLRAILLNDEQQQRLRELLPNTKIFFSPSCHCVTG
jgi:Leucine-rich repeat (LRR) protein